MAAWRGAGPGANSRREPLALANSRFPANRGETPMKSEKLPGSGHRTGPDEKSEVGSSTLPRPMEQGNRMQGTGVRGPPRRSERAFSWVRLMRSVPVPGANWLTVGQPDGGYRGCPGLGALRPVGTAPHLGPIRRDGPDLHAGLQPREWVTPCDRRPGSPLRRRQRDCPDPVG